MSRRGWVLFAVMSVLWGVPYLFIRVAVEEVHPVVVVFARVAVAAVVLVPIALWRGVLPALRGRWRALVVLALVQVVGPFLLISWGERFVSSSLTSLLIAAEPLLVAVLARWLDRAERVGPARMVGLVVGLGGVVLLLGVDLGGDPTALLGAGMVVLAAAGYAVGALMLRRPAYAGLPGLGVVTAQCVIGSVVVAPFAVPLAPAAPPSGEVLAGLAALGVFCTAAAYVAFFALVAEVGASRGTVFTYVNPAVAVALGVLLLDEPLTAATGAAFLLIVLGSWLSTGGTPPAPVRAAWRSLVRRVRPQSPGPGERAGALVLG